MATKKVQTKLRTIDDVLASAARIRAAVDEVNAALAESEKLSITVDLKIEQIREDVPHDASEVHYYYKTKTRIIGKRLLAKAIRFEIKEPD